MAEGTDPLFMNVRTGESIPFSEFFPDGSVTTAKIADGAVTEIKIGASAVTTVKIADDAVTFAKMQEITTDRLIGRDTTGTGNPEEISLSTGLEFSGSQSIRLANTAVTPGSYTSANITVDQQGRLTAASSGGAFTVIKNEAIAASSANVDIDLGSFDLVEIDLIAIEPSNDAANINAFVSQDGGSNFLSGASDYGWGFVSSGVAVSDASDSRIAVGPGIGNAAGERGTVTIKIFKPSASSFAKTMIWFGGQVVNTGAFSENQGWGMLIANTDAITDIRFTPSAGTFDAGWCVARGYTY